MNSQGLLDIARTLVAGDKGLLAMDESNPTCNKRFAKWGIPQTEDFIARLRALDGNVAVFSHSHLGRVLAARWIGLSVEQAQHFLLSTASVSILGYEHNLAETSAIVLWNAVSNEIVDLVPSPALN